MSIKKKRFIVSKKDIKYLGKKVVEKNDIGFLESPINKNADIFFIRIWKKVKLNKNDFEVINVAKTGDAFKRKICNVCHKLLDTTHFAKNQNGKNNRSVRRPSCNECRRLLEGKNASNKDKREWGKKKPSEEPFECPICHKRTIAGVTSKVVLDHNHLTGAVRGWVCDSCNTGIGRFKDDVKLIKSAIKFLE